MGRRARQFTFRASMSMALFSLVSAVRRRQQHDETRVEFSPAGTRSRIPPRNDRWNLATRQDKIYDVVVIGGSAVGLWAALDAALRGLSVCLLEAHDFGSGTTGSTPGLLQGGTHDMQRAFRRRDPTLLLIAAQNQSELKTLANVAPARMRPMDVVCPVYRMTEFIELLFCGVVSAVFALTTSDWRPPQVWNGATLKAMYPGVSHENDENDVEGAIVTRNQQIDGCRLAIDLACEASNRGAIVLNHAVVTGFEKTREPRLEGKVMSERERYWYTSKAAYKAWREGGKTAQEALIQLLSSNENTDPGLDRIRALNVLDTLTGHEYTVRCQAVLNCAGHRADDVRLMLNGDESDRIFAHITSSLTMVTSGVTPELSVPTSTATDAALLVVKNHVDAKSFFVIPHFHKMLGGVMVGSADSRHPAVANTMQDVRGVDPPIPAKPADVSFITGALATYGIALNEYPRSILSPVLPLFHAPSRNPDTIPNVIRFGQAVESKFVQSNLLTSFGANWQTARIQAERMIDLAWREILHRPRDLIDTCEPPEPPICHTRVVGLSSASASRDTRDPVVWRFGSDGAEVINAMALENPPLREPLVPAIRVGTMSKAEALYSIRYEGAETALDVMRRGQLLLADAARARDAIPQVVRFLSKELKWDRRRAEWETMAAQQYVDAMIPPVA